MMIRAFRTAELLSRWCVGYIYQVNGRIYCLSGGVSWGSREPMSFSWSDSDYGTAATIRGMGVSVRSIWLLSGRSWGAEAQ